MAQREVFALGNSGLNAFLFASVVTEVNGSSLTVLSTLARLGDDPWVRAASWARMSRAAAGAALATCIGGMPLRADDIVAAPVTAERLIDVLFTSDAAGQHSPIPGMSVQGNRPLSHLSAYMAIGFVVMLAIAAAFKAADAPPPGQDQAVPAVTSLVP